MPENDCYSVEYQLRIDGGEAISYILDIDNESLVSKLAPTLPLPDWTLLSHEQCEKCPLTGSTHCPIAARLAEPVRLFGEFPSHTPTITTVITPERTYTKQSDLQEGLRSLFGLIMATSGCPVTKPFKYMARYHLPFSSVEETITRITSTYLMRQLLHYPGEVVPVDLQEIETLYTTLQSLNKSMAQRLRAVVKQDVTLNAIIILSTYSSLIPIIIKNELQRLKSLFDY